MSGHQARVSLCMIVRDEERNLADCLSPVADLFAEIVIVDTGSRDNTKSIARQFTPKVHDFEWCDDFSAARNAALRQASGDWIFWLDADDRVRPPHVAALRQLFQRLNGQSRMFFLNTVLLGSQPNEEPQIVSHARLFRRLDNLRWRGRAHEQLESEHAQRSYERVFADAEIEHVGYQHSGLTERKARRDLRLLRMDYAIDPNNPSTLFHLGLALWRAGNRSAATEHFLRLVDMDLRGADWMRRVYGALVDLAHLAGKPDEAARFVKRGLVLFPDDEYLLFAQARIFHVSRGYAAAARVLEHAIYDAPPQQLFYGGVGNIRAKLAPRMLGAAYRMQQAYAQAASILETVVSAFPDDCESWFNLGLVLLDEVRRTELGTLIRRLLETPGGKTHARLLTALWHLRHGDLALAGQIIEDLIAADPKLTRAHMLRGEWLARSHKPPEVQRRALSEVLRIEPGNVEAQYWVQKTGQAQQPMAPVAAPWVSAPLVAMAGVPVG